MGELFALINAAGWSCGMVFARRAQQRAQVGILGGLYCSLLVNTVINLMMFLGGLLAQPLPPVTVRGMVFFVLGGVCNSLIGRGLLFYTVSLLGAARAGVVKATTPVFALLCGVFLLHEVIAPLDWLGIAAVLCGQTDAKACRAAAPEHADWLDLLVKKYGTALSPEQAQDAVKREIGAKFETCLEHAGVFKLTPDGLAAFDRFLAALGCEKL